MFIKIYKAYIQGIYTRLSIKISLAFLEINIHIINKGQELTSICSGYVYQESTKLTYNVHGVPGGQGARHSPGWSRTVKPSVARHRFPTILLAASRLFAVDAVSTNPGGLAVHSRVNDSRGAKLHAILD